MAQTTGADTATAVALDGSVLMPPSLGFVCFLSFFLAVIPLGEVIRFRFYDAAVHVCRNLAEFLGSRLQEGGGTRAGDDTQIFLSIG